MPRGRRRFSSCRLFHAVGAVADCTGAVPSTTKAALTLALAVLALVAALLDRRFRLPEMGLFVQVAAAVLSWRLVADPGLDWALAAPLGQVVLAFGGTLAALTASGWWCARCNG